MEPFISQWVRSLITVIGIFCLLSGRAELGVLCLVLGVGLNLVDRFIAPQAGETEGTHPAPLAGGARSSPARRHDATGSSSLCHRRSLRC